ncbi:MAG: two-component sensor histidine kinase, partial [Lachnospiraceae bacterium]|nr:two-component sensor histidine kinase [Lachnospiraceae bacterium]
HGIREMGGEGKIQLAVYRTDETVCISVKDNGVGMSRETIDKVLSGSYRDEEKTSDSNGVGMDNVIGRLKLFTESDEVMTIRSEGSGKGTEVIIYLQMREREDEYV